MLTLNKEDVECFTYLGSRVDKQGGTVDDVRARICKARTAFHQLKNIWGSTALTLNTKIRIFNTTVKPILLYGSEIWRTTVTTMKKIQTFINTCFRRILRVLWPVIISNQNLCERTKTQTVGEDILQKRCRWIGHTLGKSTSSTARRALTWNTHGKRKGGRPTNTWRRDLEADSRSMGKTWRQLERLQMPGEDLLVAYVLYRTTGGRELEFEIRYASENA